MAISVQTPLLAGGGILFMESKALTGLIILVIMIFYSAFSELL
jgi:hypothetical protein